MTGGSGLLTTLVAGILAQQPDVQVLDAVPAELAADVVGLAAWLAQHEVAVVVHLDLRGEELPIGAGPGNVARTVVLLGACVRAGVRRVVVRSSTQVYAVGPDAARIVGEDAPLAAEPTGLAAEAAEIERLTGLITARATTMQVITLRLAALAGGGVRTPLLLALAQRPTPILLGYAPRLQLLHPDDAAVASALAACNADARGIFNIASRGVVLLDQAVRLAGGVPLPLPDLGAQQLVALGRRVGAVVLPAALARALPVADTNRAQHTLGWLPDYETMAILYA